MLAPIMRSSSASRSRMAIAQRSALRLERKRGRVHAVAQAGRRRAIVEHVTEMRVAGGAEHFRAAHEQALVLFLAYVFLRDRGPEARPAGARFEILIRA